MTFENAIESIDRFGSELRSYLSICQNMGGNVKSLSAHAKQQWDNVLEEAEKRNGWFTRENIILSLTNLSPWFSADALHNWLKPYNISFRGKNPLNIGIIMPGNIPFAGLHDLLCVLLTGNKPVIKLSGSDTALMQFIIDKLKEAEPEWNALMCRKDLYNGNSSSAPFPVKELDAVIATGSNNSAKHFEYYFKNIPSVIRRNRNSAAVLDGSETEDELGMLGRDIFSYYGLGCRNISKLYIPYSYNFNSFFRNIEKYGSVINHHKYANNYLYNRTVFLMDGVKFSDNDFLLLVENPAITSPCATVYFEYYTDLPALANHLCGESEKIQCIACNERIKDELLQYIMASALKRVFVNLGQTQSPALTDYADGKDVIEFLLNISKATIKKHKAKTA